MQICLVLSIVSTFVHPYCCCLYNLNCVCLPKSILHDLCSSARMLLYAFLGVSCHFTSSGWCPVIYIQMKYKVHFPFNFGRIGRNKVAMNNERPILLPLLYLFLKPMLIFKYVSYRVYY